jgi:hypothetical protein
MRNLTFSDNKITNHITDSSIYEISNVTIADLPQIAFIIEQSNVTSIDSLFLQDLLQGMKFYKSTVSSFTNSKLRNLGGFNILKGGALHIHSSSVSISNCTFANNTAHAGGAVKIECGATDICNNAIKDSVFENNTAIDKGADIEYNSFRPSLDNVTYSSIYSYPVKIIVQNSLTDEIILNNVGSGIAYHKILKLALVDYDNQEMFLENTSQIKILSNTAGASLAGVDYARTIAGVGAFSHLVFKYSPGAMNVSYVATSKTIDEGLINAVFGQQFSDNRVEINFRLCQPGERIVGDGTCLE